MNSERGNSSPDRSGVDGLGPVPVPPLGMSVAEFRTRAKEMVDWIADYYENIESLPVRSTVSPGYMENLLPEKPPQHPEDWKSIIADVDRVIMPGISHWQSPRFNAYFPSGSSFPAQIAEMLSNAFNAIGFSWINSPALTELETIMMDWLVDMMALPSSFSSKSTGGGVIQGSASESCLCAVLAARDDTLHGQEGHFAVADLCAYVSSQAHGCFVKAFKLAGLSASRIRTIPISHIGGLSGSVDPQALQNAINDDIAAGLKPMFIGATMGTTTAAHYDALDVIGPIAKEFGLWLHVDAAYAGTALVCPEHRQMAKGLEFADSYCFNPHKWMLTNFDCSTLFVADRRRLLMAMDTSMEIYRNRPSASGKVRDYRNWQVPLGRRFRALKLFFVIRSFGVEGIRHHIRRDCKLAAMFDALVRGDDRFEVLSRTHLGLVCFHLRPRSDDEVLDQTNARNLALVEALNADGRIWLTHSIVDGRIVLRYAICCPRTEPRHVEDAFRTVQALVDRQI